MKMKGIVMGALVLAATAAPPTTAGTWDADPTASTWGAVSAGQAKATAVTSGVPVEKSGPDLDKDGDTRVKLVWTPAYQNEPAPTNPQYVSFMWQPSGNVDSVQEQSGQALARADFYLSQPGGYLSEFHIATKTRQNGVTTGTSVSESIRNETFDLPWGVTTDGDQTYIVPQLTLSVYTYASAEFDAPSGGGSAEAISAAATLSIVTNSMSVP